jgi:membrane protease YdiL (CAAX protease family)
MTTTDPVQSANRLGLRRVFYGPSGLRAGWRALGFFILLFAAVESQANYILKVEHDIFGVGETPGGVLLEKALLFGCALVLTVIFGSFERRSLAEYGLPLRKIFGAEFWAGALWGFGILTVNIALMILSHAYSFGTIALSVIAILKYGFLWAVGFLAVGIAEEFAFRGYLQYTLTRGMGFWPASVLTSILFGLIHLDVQAPWPAIVNIAVLALFVCMALHRTGNLWFRIGSHAAFDWGEAFFYSTSHTKVEGHLFNASLHSSKWLSGGDAGPEGNIFNVFLVAAGIFLLSRVYPQVKYPTAIYEISLHD